MRRAGCVARREDRKGKSNINNQPSKLQIRLQKLLASDYADRANFIFEKMLLVCQRRLIIPPRAANEGVVTGARKLIIEGGENCRFAIVMKTGNKRVFSAASLSLFIWRVKTAALQARLWRFYVAVRVDYADMHLT